MAQFKLFFIVHLKPPRRRDIDDKLAYNSNNYLILIGTTNIIVNNSKIDDKISANFLLIPNKYITFATDKDTFVLLTIKKVIVCLI